MCRGYTRIAHQLKRCFPSVGVGLTVCRPAANALLYCNAEHYSAYPARTCSPCATA